VLHEAEGACQVDIWATGSEVYLATTVRDLLQEKGIGARVISVPCWRLFDAQPQDYQETLTASPALKVVIEAACLIGWEKYVGTKAVLCGLSTFGASAPKDDLYQAFGLTPAAIAARIQNALVENR
jgi:transketolase